MSQKEENLSASNPTKTLISVHRGTSVPSVVRCPNCGGEMVPDASSDGGSICPACHTVRKASPPQFTPGSVVGKYRVLTKLARGGMGVLYLCCPVDDLSVRFVLKTLPFDLGEKSVYIKRFRRESRLLRRLNHETIVRVHDSWSDAWNAYIVMEYIDGNTLENIRKRELYHFDEGTLIHIMRLLADALNYAWKELKLLHRDIKPSNIMIDRKGHLHLLDFGIAKSLESEDSTVLTIAGNGLGTPGFMSPEQFWNTEQLDCTTDIYGLGATVYFLVTGEPPFTGKDPHRIFADMLKKDPVPLRERNPEISENLSQLVQQMLSRDPKKRPPGWDVLKASLDLVANGRTPPAAGM